MKKPMLCLLLTAVIIIAFTFLTTACNKTPDDMFTGKPLSGTLTISQCYDFYFLEDAIEKFTAIHPDVEIILNKYDNNTKKYNQQITTQLLAGEADDIIDATAFSKTAMADSGLLADFYPLMQNDPNFNEDDYYMNVFNGMAYKGKLVVFPTSFTYEVVGVNNIFSAELTERYKQYETITYRQILDLYNGLDDKGGRYLCKCIDAVTAIQTNFNTFIDFENRTCDFNNADFVKFITDLKNATSPQKSKDGELGWSYGLSPLRADQSEYAAQYLFDNYYSSNYYLFFPYTDNGIFTHYIPTANEKGNLILQPQKQFCISETAKNKELAWEFIKFLTTPEANENVSIPSFPVHRELFKTFVASDMVEILDYCRKEVGAIDGDNDKVIAHVMALLEKYNEMPMEYPQIAEVEYDIIMEVMENFYNGTLSAEQAASELQNKISLYLME